VSEVILVTGGAGFIGSNFVHHWHRRHPGDTILVLDSLTYASDYKQIIELNNLELVNGNIQNQDLVMYLLDHYNVRKIVHFAAESHVDNSIHTPSVFIQTNVVGTFSLLEAARMVWAGDIESRFLHVSTDEVFGSLDFDGEKFNENSPYLPNSPYSASKAASDHLVRAYHHTYGLPTLTTNCSNNYGPRQHREKLIPLAITRMACNQPIPIYGNGQNIRDWLFVEDHCAALETVLTRGIPGDTYCIGGDNEWKNVKLLEFLCDAVDRHLKRTDGTSRSLLKFVPDRAGHDLRYAIDPTKIKDSLGWNAQTSLSEGLEKTISWYL